MRPLTGVILASGEGSRMKEVTESLGLPKHLLPLGGDTVVTRLARQIESYSDRLVVTVPEGAERAFSEAFDSAEIPAEFRVSPQGSGFDADLASVGEVVEPKEQLLLAVGDIVFQDGLLEQFCKKVQHSRARVIAGLRWGDGKWFDPVGSAYSFPGEVIHDALEKEVDPEDTFGMIRFALSQVIKGKVQTHYLPVFANLNSPFEYAKALDLFEGY